MLGRERLPEFQRLDHGGIVEIGLQTIRRHQLLAVLDGKRLEHPIGVARGRDHQAVCVALGQGLAHADQLIPACGRGFGIKARVAEHVLVVIGHDGRTLERDAPGLALDAAVGHQGGVEAVEPCGIDTGDILEGNDRFLFDQVIGVDREHDRQLRRLARGDGRQGAHARVVVIARIDRVDLDVGIGLFEFRDDAIDDFGQRATDGDRVIHRQFRFGGNRCGNHGCHGGGQSDLPECVHDGLPWIEHVRVRLPSGRRAFYVIGSISVCVEKMQVLVGKIYFQLLSSWNRLQPGHGNGQPLGRRVRQPHECLGSEELAF
mmetsp:Transcript_11564/g.18610  ORF Transcript_11564/g.18610 Transcript_11564/m.18610 type:complete len:317 (+) Transcript_11564:572-1522(+)